MPLNEVRLKSLIDHLDKDLGSADVVKMATLLKGKPENPAYLREYVVEASKRLKDDSHVEDFDNSVKEYQAKAAVSAPDESKKVEAGPATQSPPSADEIASKPEAQVKAAKAPKTTPAPAAPAELSPAQAAEGQRQIEALRAGLAPYSFRFRDENGIASDVVVTHVGKSGIVVLGKAPTDITVKVTLKGVEQSLNLTELRKKAAGDTVNVGGNEYLVAALLVIAEHAQG